MLLASATYASNNDNQQGFQRIEQKTWELFHGNAASSSPQENPHTTTGSIGEETTQYYGIVDKTQVSGGYTYILLETSDGPIWAATGQVKLAKGEKIRLNQAFPMHNFHAKSLNKTFDVILFAGSVSKAP